MSFITFLRYGQKYFYSEFEPTLGTIQIIPRTDQGNDGELSNSSAKFKRIEDRHLLPTEAYENGEIFLDVSAVNKVDKIWQSFQRKSDHAICVSMISLGCIAAWTTWKIVNKSPFSIIVSGICSIGPVALVALSFFVLHRRHQAIHVRHSLVDWEAKIKKFKEALKGLEGIEAAHKSRLLLFQLLGKFSKSTLEKVIKETPVLWPAGNSSYAYINDKINDGNIYQVEIDMKRMHYIIEGNDIYNYNELKLEMVKKLT
jgi:hypothetical protein